MLSLLRAKPTVARIKVGDLYFSEITRFRYKTYCEELNFLDASKYPDKKETDEYDDTSIHIVVKVGKRLAGYARVILPINGSLPVFVHFKSVDKPNDLLKCCEISRFIISKTYRKKQATRREIFRLLAEEIQAVSRERGIEYIYAVVEEWLLRSLKKRFHNIEAIGEGKYFMGAITIPIKMELR